MKIINISWPITENITEYKDKGTVKLEPLKEFERDEVRETLLTMSVHTGTHIDAPSHFLAKGRTVEKMALEKLIGPCRVLDLTGCDEKITRNDLESYHVKPNEIILLKTKNSECEENAPFHSAFVYLEQSGAEYLASRGVLSVGIDYLGIERSQPGHETHTALLMREIPIIEGLRLGRVEPGEYTLYCLPLHIPGIEAAPCRAILMH